MVLIMCDRVQEAHFLFLENKIYVALSYLCEPLVEPGTRTLNIYTRILPSNL